MKRAAGALVVLAAACAGVDLAHKALALADGAGGVVADERSLFYALAGVGALAPNPFFAGDAARGIAFNLADVFLATGGLLLLPAAALLFAARKRRRRGSKPIPLNHAIRIRRLGREMPCACRPGVVQDAACSSSPS